MPAMRSIPRLNRWPMLFMPEGEPLQLIRSSICQRSSPRTLHLVSTVPFPFPLLLRGPGGPPLLVSLPPNEKGGRPAEWFPQTARVDLAERTHVFLAPSSGFYFFYSTMMDPAADQRPRIIASSTVRFSFGRLDGGVGALRFCGWLTFFSSWSFLCLESDLCFISFHSIWIQKYLSQVPCHEAQPTGSDSFACS